MGSGPFDFNGWVLLEIVSASSNDCGFYKKQEIATFF